MNFTRHIIARDGLCVICESRKMKRASNHRVFRFPYDPDRSRVWVKAAGIKSLIHLSLEELHYSKFVCSLHFSPLCFNPKGGLHMVAIPILNLPYPPLPDSLLVGFPPQKSKVKDIPDTEVSSEAPNSMNMETSIDVDIPLMNCIETVMNIGNINEPIDTLNDKGKEMRTSNIEHVNLYLEGVAKNSNNAFPVPLMNCTKTILRGRGGEKVNDAPRTFISKIKKYGKCYRKESFIKIMKQKKILESINSKSIALRSIIKDKSADAENIIDAAIMNGEPSDKEYVINGMSLKREKMPETTNPHGDIPIGNERSLDSGTTFDTPLMNCTDTIFKHGQIYFGKRANDNNVKTIDIPLMQCLKTIE